MNGRDQKLSLILLLPIAIIGLTTPADAQTTIAFGQQTVWTTSSEKYVTTVCCASQLGGNGFFSFTVTGDFKSGPSTTCGSSIPFGSTSCDFYVVFVPTQVGPLTGQVIFQDMSASDCQFGCPPVKWNLTGTGVLPPPPLAPTANSAVANSSSQITLSWTDNSSNEDGFRIQRSADGANFATVKTNGANTTSYSDGGLSASTTYYYRIQAFNLGGNSAYVTFPAATTQPPPPPTAPTNLSGIAYSSSLITLTWSDNSSDEQGFIIQRSTDNVNFSVIGSTPANVTSYSDMFLQPSITRYYYRVGAFNKTVFSSLSNVVSVGFAACDINNDGAVNVVDIQLVVNQAILAAPATSDINGDGVVNVLDVQLIVNAALGIGCRGFTVRGPIIIR